MRHALRLSARHPASVDVVSQRPLTNTARDAATIATLGLFVSHHTPGTTGRKSSLSEPCLPESRVLCLFTSVVTQRKDLQARSLHAAITENPSSCSTFLSRIASNSSSPQISSETYHVDLSDPSKLSVSCGEVHTARVVWRP